jgi:hypothetical protein
LSSKKREIQGKTHTQNTMNMGYSGQGVLGAKADEAAISEQVLKLP